MTDTRITIPAGLDFSALKLTRKPDTGAVVFDVSTVEAIERASGLPEGHYMSQPEAAVAELITVWYAHHIAAGGAPDPVAEGLAAEVRAEDAFGGGLSHQPGRA